MRKQTQKGGRTYPVYSLGGRNQSQAGGLGSLTPSPLSSIHYLVGAKSSLHVTVFLLSTPWLVSSNFRKQLKTMESFCKVYQRPKWDLSRFLDLFPNHGFSSANDEPLDDASLLCINLIFSISQNLRAPVKWFCSPSVDPCCQKPRNKILHQS